jgi:hypothetical protein
MSQTDFWGLTEQDHLDAIAADQMMDKEHEKYFTKYRADIIGRMVAERAESLSDEEIKRCFADCVCGCWLAPVAMHARDLGMFTLDDLSMGAAA